MRVLIVGKNERIGHIGETYRRAFLDIGHEAEIYDMEKSYWDRLQKFDFLGKYFKRIVNFLFYRLFSIEENKNLLRYLKDKEFDFILVSKGWLLNPKVIKKIKQKEKGPKVFCYTGDDALDFLKFNNSNGYIRRSISLYDAYFSWSKFVSEKIKRINKSSYWLPVAADDRLHYSVKLSSKDMEKYGSDVVFIGGWDSYREKMLSIVARHFNVKIWGNGWEKSKSSIVKEIWTGRAALGEEFSKICKSSKVVLNFIRQPRKSLSHNMRNFEIPQSGGMQLSTRTKEVLFFFEEDENICCFSCEDEMISKIKYCLKNEDYRKNIVKKSFNVVKLNTYRERARKIINIFNNNIRKEKEKVNKIHFV